MNQMKQIEEKEVLDIQEDNIKCFNLEEDKKHKPKTKPQISNKMYAKWLTDKYNKDTDELKAKIIDLEYKLKEANEKINVLTKAANKTRLKYMTEKNEFSKDLMRDDQIKKYRREILNLQKALSRSRKDNETLIMENLRLKDNNNKIK